MKGLVLLLCVLFTLSGCSREDPNMAAALALRQCLNQAKSCMFQAVITADYGEQIYRFRTECTADREGNLRFVVAEPESIAGISGEIYATGGRLTFDDAVLGFPLLADGMLTPVSGPWIFFRSLRSGYLTSCGVSDAGILITVNDSYQEDALQLDIWLNENTLPFYCEIFWQGRRVLSLEIEDFVIK